MTNKLKNRSIPMAISVFILICTSAPLGFLDSDTGKNWIVFPLAAL